MTLIIATGASGTRYQLRAYPIGTELPNEAGVYIFCHQDLNGDWIAHYVGQAYGLLGLDQRVGTCVRSHEKHDPAVKRGATHVAAATAKTCTREEICGFENDLIQGLNPPLNQKAPPGFGLRNKITGYR